LSSYKEVFKIARKADQYMGPWKVSNDRRYALRGEGDLWETSSKTEHEEVLDPETINPDFSGVMVEHRKDHFHWSLFDSGMQIVDGKSSSLIDAQLDSMVAYMLVTQHSNLEAKHLVHITNQYGNNPSLMEYVLNRNDCPPQIRAIHILGE
jgi:hypothetical protein